MKNIFTAMLAIGLFAQTSFAQDLTNRTNKKLEPLDVEKTSGIEVGMIYSNLTDVNIKFEGSYTYSRKTTNFNETAKGGTHVGALGINVNYKNKTALNSFGYYYGAAILQSINTSEASNAINFYKTQGGMSYSPISHFSLYKG